MALTLLEAAKLSRNPLARGAMLAVATSDQLISQLLMEATPGESFSYNREKDLATAEFVSPTHVAITESSSTFDRVTVPMRLLVTDLDQYLFALEQMSETNPQEAQQVSMKLKALGRTIANKAINGGWATSATVANSGVSPGAALSAIVVGPNQDSDRHGPARIKYTHTGTFWQYAGPGDVDYGPQLAVAGNATVRLVSSNPNKFITVTITVASATANGETLITFASTTHEPDGMLKLVTTNQTVTAVGADGDQLTLDVLDQLIDEKVKVMNRPVFMMNSKLKRKYFQIARGLGGVAAEVMTLPGVVGSLPSYRGIPIIQNDWVPSTEVKGAKSNLSSVVLVDLSTEGFMARCGQAGSAVAVDASPAKARIMGLKIRKIGELEDKEAERTRFSWYGAFQLGSELAIARASQLRTD